jgi:hypothetical protein
LGAAAPQTATEPYPFKEPPRYYGEIAIDPASGAILRLALQADLKSTTPVVRSDIMIEYGPVEIGGKTYICPVRSVSITRARSVIVLTALGDGFRTYGPYATKLNNIVYEGYHVFRVKARILTGSETMLEEKSPGSDSQPPSVVPPNLQ